MYNVWAGGKASVYECALKPNSRTTGEIGTGVYMLMAPAYQLKSWDLHGSCEAVQHQKGLMSTVSLKVPSSFCTTNYVNMHSAHLQRWGYFSLPSVLFGMLDGAYKDNTLREINAVALACVGPRHVYM